METLVLDALKDADVQTVARLLRERKLVAFPTETVYGLGARADDERAVERIFQLKHRPRDRELTLLIPRPEAAVEHAGPLGRTAQALADRFWPGPLTLVVPDGAGGQVGLRCPDCEVTRNMLNLAGVPVVAPSANLSGERPARTAGEVLDVFGGKIEAVLDGGPARLGTASTVVRVDEEGAEILREGALSREQILATLP